MAEHRRTFNRRTFIKTAGGLVVSLPFSGLLSPAHAADLPERIAFRVTVSRHERIDGQSCLDTAVTGFLTVVGPDQTETRYTIDQGGRLQFELRTVGTSMLVLNVYGQTGRYFIATFENGLLYLKNSDRGDRSMVYNWNPVENCYTIEYWQDNIYICGPADGEGYFTSQAYQNLNPNATLSRLSDNNPLTSLRLDRQAVPMASCFSGCTPALCEVWRPSCAGCSFCLTAYTEDLYGVPTNTVVSHGSTKNVPAGGITITRSGATGEYNGGCRRCDGKDEYITRTADAAVDDTGAPMANAGETQAPFSSPEFRMTVTPSKAALERINQGATAQMFPAVEFGLMASLTDPDGVVLSSGYAAIGTQTTFPDGVIIDTRWIDDISFPKVIINSTWPADLFSSSRNGVYMFSGYMLTNGGLASNKRCEYFEVDVTD